LIYAFREGFKTSVSIEPYLDNPIPLINDIALYCTESIWLGIMNPVYYKYNFHTYDKVKLIVNEIKKIFSMTYPESILKKIRLKDSIRNLGVTLD